MSLRSYIAKKFLIPTSKKIRASQDGNSHSIEIKVIDEIMKAITSSFDLDIVGQSIVDIMANYLQSLGGTLLITKEDGFIYAHSTSNTPIIRAVLRILPKPFREHKYTITKKTSNLISRTVMEKKSFQSKKYEEFIAPEVPKRIAKLIPKMADIKNSITIPAIAENKVMGVLFISFAEEKLTDKQLAILSVFADQAAIAINNSQKFQEQQDQYQKVRELYEMEKETSALLSHEFKTPIAIMHNTTNDLDHLLDKHKDNLGIDYKKLKKVHNSLTTNSKKMQLLSESIFSLREVENQVTATLQKLDFYHLLELMIQNHQRRAKAKGLKFSYKIKEDVKDFSGPGIQFEQVVSILLDNAVKYTKKGSIEVKIHLKKDIFTCSIWDTGAGIPKKDKTKILDRFYRGESSKNSGESGLGIGLYIANKILTQFKGSIAVKNNPKNKKGTLVRVKMPVKG